MASNPATVNNHLASDEAPLTIEVLKGVVPKRQKHNITKSLVDSINSLVSDPEARNVFRENLLGFSGALADPNVKMSNFLLAVKYVSYKLLDYTNQEAWIKTFPDRYQRLVSQKKDPVWIRATVGSYHKGKLVQALLEQSMTPTWVLNADLFQKAINAQAHLMVTAQSEKVRTDAANSLLTHLKQPETTKLKLDIEVRQDDSIRELKNATLALVEEQRRAIKAGANTAEEIAKGKIIPGESKRVN